MKLPVWATTVTPLSKILAGIFFIIFPIIGFYLGIQYQKMAPSIPSSQTSPPSISIQPNTISKISSTPIKTVLKYVPKKRFDLETYGWELTAEQDDRFLNEITKVDEPYPFTVDLTSTPSSPSAIWKYWVGADSGVQNTSYLVKNNIVCQETYYWCGASTPQSVAQECANYQVDEKSEELPKGNTNQCCRAFKTKRPSVFTCVDIFKRDSADIVENKNITYEILKEAGIDCHSSACLSPVKVTMTLFTPEFYSY
ncbi:MAG: hypothetical protein Q7S61_05330 [bacterium]|nr:hypothetical protein [bacterium]